MDHTYPYSPKAQTGAKYEKLLIYI